MYLFDTYALIEILRGNPAYAAYENAIPQTTLLNIAELQYFLLREVGEEKAVLFLKEFRAVLVDINEEITFEAMRFRLKHKKSRISMTDAVGYVAARRYRLRFLTGDKEFERLPNVEFVK